MAKQYKYYCQWDGQTVYVCYGTSKKAVERIMRGIYELKGKRINFECWIGE